MPVAWQYGVGENVAGGSPAHKLLFVLSFYKFPQVIRYTALHSAAKILQISVSINLFHLKPVFYQQGSKGINNTLTT